jgi:HlyD family secretion protein
MPSGKVVIASAKVVALKARAYQISHLCFPVHGIIEYVNATKERTPGRLTPTFPTLQLGDPVTQFDFTAFYAGLSKTSSGDPSRLSYDSSGILNDASVQASLLMTQRREATAAVLDKAINARQNAYYAKYANQDKIISVMRNFYTATASAPNASMSKPDALAKLYGVAQDQMSDLISAYKEAKLPSLKGLPSVVKETSSVLKTTGSFPDTNQTITNTDYAYRTPAYEAQAQGLRAQISLLDQQLSQFLAGQNLPNLPQVFKNELQGIDLDVKRLQIAYLNTILMSPINGVITGIYKSEGDWVQAGEPVIRVEDNSSVILAGTLAYQGLISIGSQLTVTTSLFDSSGSTSLVGNVIAVRGRPNEDDVWDVHAICDNSAAPVLPLNYHFDYDDTSVGIS